MLDGRLVHVGRAARRGAVALVVRAHLDTRLELGVLLGITHGAPPHRAPSTRCTAESMHHVWRRSELELELLPVRVFLPAALLQRVRLCVEL